MKKTIFTAASIIAMLSSSVVAGTYEYTPDVKEPKKVQVFKLEFKGPKVHAEFCHDSGKCTKGEAITEALTKKLASSISEYEKLLSNKDALVADAKKQVAAKDAQIINDEANKKKFVMIKAGDMNLAIDMENVKKGDFSLVSAAMESNRDRYKASMDILKSGKAPAPFKTAEYSEIATVYQITNIVIHTK